MPQRLLSINDLRTHFFTLTGVVKAVDGVSFSIDKGETLGLVGESGSGKTVTALSIMRLIPRPGKIVSGSAEFEGIGNLVSKTESEMRRIRGKNIAMSFQDPMTYLNPVLKVGDQIAETICLHQNMSTREAKEEAIDSMRLVGIPSPEARAKEYPHQMSGGMRQRIMLAMALSCQPELLIADEPTTALDVIIQDEILSLMKDLKLNNSLLIITHDLGVVAELSDRVAIMYAGHLMENAHTRILFKRPRNPYTQALLESIPRVDWGKRRLRAIQGSIPDMISPPSGCRFHPRCSYVEAVCRDEVPRLQEVEPGHWTACHRWQEIRC